MNSAERNPIPEQSKKEVMPISKETAGSIFEANFLRGNSYRQELIDRLAVSQPLLAQHIIETHYTLFNGLTTDGDLAAALNGAAFCVEAFRLESEKAGKNLPQISELVMDKTRHDDFETVGKLPHEIESDIDSSNPFLVLETSQALFEWGENENFAFEFQEPYLKTLLEKLSWTSMDNACRVYFLMAYSLFKEALESEEFTREASKLL